MYVSLAQEVQFMIRSSAAIFFILCLLGISLLAPPSGAKPLPVFVSILPQKYFVEKIGDGLVDVSVMVAPGYNPHIYEPKPNQMVALSKARIYFAIGITFEDAWLGKFAAINPKMLVVHTEAGIEKIPMLSHYPHEVLEDEGEQEAKDEHEGEYGTMDPHVWLSPPEVKVIAKNILRALQEADPANSPIYEENAMRFREQIERLDSELRSIFAGKKRMKFMVFHPSWGYFARAYGLEQVPIEIEGKEPKAAQLRKIIEYARKERIKVIFVQPQFSTKSAETIAKAVGAQVVFADPLSPDWGKSLRDQAEKFKAALR
jgi:zinc transport system substrate-binding protein